MTELEKRRKFALELIDLAAEASLELFQKPLQIDVKKDESEVTEADRNIELKLRERIRDEFPQDGIRGEEFQENPNEQADFTWTLDPIDGTRAFIHGIPMFGNMLGIIHEDRAVLGVVGFPATREIIYAQESEGTFWRPLGDKHFQKCRVSQTKSLAQATFCYSGYEFFKMNNRTELFEAFQRKTKISRSWGNCYGYALVATGRADFMVDPVFELWDLVPLKPLIQEAGGSFFGINGEESIYCRSAVATNQYLIEEIKSTLGVKRT